MTCEFSCTVMLAVCGYMLQYVGYVAENLDTSPFFQLGFHIRKNPVASKEVYEG